MKADEDQVMYNLEISQHIFFFIREKKVTKVTIFNSRKWFEIHEYLCNNENDFWSKIIQYMDKATLPFSIEQHFTMNSTFTNVHDDQFKIIMNK